MKDPAALRTVSDVADYWTDCLALRAAGSSEYDVAAMMVGIVSNSREQAWSSDPHPAYDMIFELAASLELPDKMTSHRRERWHCIIVLLKVLRDESKNSSPSGLDELSNIVA